MQHQVACTAVLHFLLVSIGEWGWMEEDMDISVKYKILEGMVKKGGSISLLRLSGGHNSQEVVVKPHLPPFFFSFTVFSHSQQNKLYIFIPNKEVDQMILAYQIYMNLVMRSTTIYPLFIYSQ